jgi:hypothetical protein
MIAKIKEIINSLETNTQDDKFIGSLNGQSGFAIYYFLI